MKKLLGLLMVLALTVPASAELLRNFELKGDVQLVSTDSRHRDNFIPREIVSGTDLRVMVGGGFDVADNVRANLMFQYLNIWGEDATIQGGGPIGTVGKSIDGYLNSIRVVEANVEMKEIFGWLDAKMGRQFYGDEDSSVLYIGPRYYTPANVLNGWNYATALDAVRLAYANDVVNVNVMTGEAALYDGLAAPISPTGTKHNIYGADAKFKMGDVVRAQFYAYNIKELYGEDNFGFYGGKLSLVPENFLFSLEYARNMSGHRVFKESHDNPYMLKAEAKITVDELTPRAAFWYNKNFTALGNYTPGLLIGDIYGDNLGEVRMYNLGADLTADQWTFSLDGFAFQDRTAKHAANLEADLVVKYAYNDNIEIFGGVGYIKYKDTFKARLNTKDNTKGQIGVLIKL